MKEEKLCSNRFPQYLGGGTFSVFAFSALTLLIGQCMAARRRQVSKISAYARYIDRERRAK